MKNIILFLIFLVCTSVLVKPKKCKCVTEIKVYKNGKVVILDYAPHNFTLYTHNALNYNDKTVIPDSTVFSAANP